MGKPAASSQLNADTLRRAERRAHGQVEARFTSARGQDSQTFVLTNLGPRPEACREPINISSRSSNPAIRLISNFARTPFELHSEQYASIEAFWQGLKFADPA